MIDNSRSFGMVMTVSTHSRSASSPASACSARFFPSNLNGLVTTAIVSAPSSLARLTITGAAPKAGRHADHVGARQRLDDVVGVFERRLPPDVRIGAGTQPLRELVADLQLLSRPGVIERLQVGVGDDELHAAKPHFDHAVD